MEAKQKKSQYDIPEDLSALSREELVRIILELRETIRSYESPPPNDWHTWFYAQLMISLHRFFPAVKVHRELSLGVQPPRADFVIVENGDVIDLGLDIFRCFRKHNILEFKSPDDELNEAVLWKVIGYAGFYMSTQKESVPADEVTLTLVRAAQPVKLLKQLEPFIATGEAPGIYRIAGWTVDLPIQIIVTSELKGQEYAGFRAICRKPDLEDIRQVLLEGDRETDSFVIEQYRAFFTMLSQLDSEQMDEARRRFPNMAKTWRDIFHKEIDEWIQEAVTVAVSDTHKKDLFLYVSKGFVPVDYAAEHTGMSPELFSQKMKEAGYSLPQSPA